MRLLYLAFSFPPARGSGVHRARATANFLAANGWEVTALAAPMDFLREVVGSLDLSLTVDPRVRVHRPALQRFVWQHDLRGLSPVRALFPGVAYRAHRWGQRHLFPEPYASWGLAAARQGLTLHRRRRFDAVLATGNPYASFAAAWALHRLTGVPYLLDYRDAWTLNQFTGAPAYPPEHPAWAWERRVLSRAAAVSFVNEAQRDWHAARYPHLAERMLVVRNGWDPEVVAQPAGGAAKGPLRFAYLGTLTPGQPLEQLLAGFATARRDPALAGARLDVYGYLGFFPAGQAALAARLAAPAVRYHGPVPKAEVARVYRDSDVLVLLTAGGRYVTTGKVFEYLATGRPIVSVHEPECDASRVLSGYPLWFNPQRLEPDAIAGALLDAARAARGIAPAQQALARRYAERYRRDGLLAPLEARLREAAGG